MRTLAMLAAGTTSCTGSTSTDCAEGPIEVTLGSGMAAFEPLAEGDDVTMVFGPQGGWHIDVSAHLSGIGPEVELRPAARRVSDGLPLAGDQQAIFLLLADYDATSCTGDAMGIRAFVDDATPDVPYPDFICSLDGAPIELSLEVSDFGSRTASDSLVVTARPDPSQVCY